MHGMDLSRFPPFDTRQLRYFLAVAEAGSFSRAALQLNVAQPALSQTIKDMEADLGLKLLDRLPRGVAPTSAGKLLAQDARAILTQIQIARQRLQDEGAAPSGVVGLGVPSSISEMVTMPMVQSVLLNFPKIQFRIAEAMSTHLLDWVVEGRIDLAIVFSSMGRKGLRCLPVLREELVLVGAADATLPTGADELTLPALEQINFVLPSSAFGIRKLIDGVDALGGTRFNLVAEVDSMWHIKNLVRQGVGFSILPKFVVKQEVEDGMLRCWPIRNPPIRRTIHIATSAERPQTQAVQTVEYMLRGVFYGLVQQGLWDAEMLEGLSGAHTDFASFVAPAMIRDPESARDQPVILR